MILVALWYFAQLFNEQSIAKDVDAVAAASSSIQPFVGGTVARISVATLSGPGGTCLPGMPVTLIAAISALLLIVRRRLNVKHRLHSILPKFEVVDMGELLVAFFLVLKMLLRMRSRDNRRISSKLRLDFLVEVVCMVMARAPRR